MEEVSFPMEATILALEAKIQEKMGLSAISFLSDDGSAVKKTDHLKDH